MCEHNAHRDEYILKPLKVKSENGGTEIYEPLSAKKITNNKYKNMDLLDTVEIS
jgi:hypothetical protein